jgi:uncharacterized repeat protein (TIGR01451 family)
MTTDKNSRPKRGFRRCLIAVAVLASVLTFVLPGAPTTAAPPTPLGNLPASSSDTAFSAGSLIIDLAASTSPAGIQAKPDGLRPYGLVYFLVTDRKVPVHWIIADGKSGNDSILTPGSAPVDFTATVQVDRVGPTNVTKSYQSGAFVIPAEFVTPAVTSLIDNALFGSTTVVDVATAPFTAPVFDKITYWPRAVLDAQNGALAIPFYTNAGIPANPLAYQFKAPSQLNSCDDIYVMPHADPTWATHQNLLAFNNQGGYIWAACHAPSVLENLVNPSNPSQRLNFLSNNGLVNFKLHGAGSPPYSYSSDGSDPVMQFIGRIDTATQNGSEQIFLPAPGVAPNGGWRPTTKNLVWDPTQINLPGERGEAGDDQARVLTYGRGFGNENNGLVQYLGGHSANKGSVGDVAAQRSYFNFLLLGGIERRVEIDVNVPNPLPSGSPVTVSATLDRGAPAYTYEWYSTCGGTFGQKAGVLTSAGTIETTFTPPAVAGSTPCNIRLEVVDNCNRNVFGVDSSVVTPVADLQVVKVASDDTIGNGDSLSYTITVTNNGPAPAENAVLVDTVPFGLTVDSVSPAPSSVDGLVYTWNLGTLANGASAVITINTTAAAAGFVAVNTANAISETPDPNPFNNTSSTSTAVVNAGLVIEKIARPELVPSAGGNVTYEYRVRNSGDSPISNVVVEDNPNCSPIVWDSSTDLNGNGLLDPPVVGFPTEIWRYTCDRFVDAGTPDEDSDVDGEFIASTSATPGTKQNVVRARGLDVNGEDVFAWATATVTVSSPAIAVTKTLSPPGQTPMPGGTATFTISVTNIGGVPLTNVSTTDAWPGTCSVTIPDLDIGQTYTYSCSATVPAGSGASENWDTPATPANPGSYQGGTGWTGDWTETDNGNATTGNVRVEAGGALPVGYSSPNVLRMGTASTNSIQRDIDLSGPSANVSFRYHRTANFNNNSGAFHVETWTGTVWQSLGIIVGSGVNVADANWQTFTASVPAASRISGGILRFRIVDANTNRIVSVDDVSITKSATNTVTADATDIFGEPVTDDAEESVGLGATPPALTITKTASPAAVRAGNTLTYTVTVTNTGATAQTGVVLADPLPSGLNLVSASGTLPGTNATENWDTPATPANPASYQGGTGWVGNWIDDEDNNPLAGRNLIVNGGALPAGYSSPNVLEYRGNTANWIRRGVNLAGATEATVSFDYHRSSLFNGSNRNFNVDLCLDNASCVQIGSIAPTGVATADAGWTTFSWTGSSNLAANTFLRFGNGTDLNNRTIYVDNISVTSPPTNLSGLPTAPFTLAPGQSLVYTIVTTAAAAPADGFQYPNLASVTSTEQPAPVAATTSTPYLDPSISVTKTAVEGWINEFDPTTHDIFYVFEVRNTGNTTLTPVSVTDPLCDAAPVYVSGDLNTNGSLELGEVWRYTCPRNISGTAQAGSDPVEFPNTVTVTFADPVGADVVGQASALVKVIHPQIALDVTPTATTIFSGETVTYVYEVTNPGNIPIFVDKTTGVTAQNCSPVTYQGGDVNANGMVDQDETWTFACTTGPIIANQSGQTAAVNGVELVFDYGVSDSTDVAVNVIDPSISITKIAEDSVSSESGTDIEVGLNNDVTYVYEVTNTGDIDLDDIDLFDDTCAAPTYISGDDGDGILNPAETWVFTCASGQLDSTTVNNAVVTAAYDAPGLSGTVASDQVSARVRVVAPGLLIFKRADAEFVRVGATVNYSYEVRNVGETAFTQAGLGTPTDTVDDVAGPTACAAIAGPFDEDGDPIGAGVDLDPGDTWFYECATVVSDTVLNVFTFPNAEDVFGSPYEPAPGVAQVFAVDPGFAITKSATTSIDGPGTDILGMSDLPVTYTITVTGNAGAFDPIDMDDPLGPFILSINAMLVDVDDPTCDTTPTLVSGDTNGNGQLESGESWVFTCQLDELPVGPTTDNTVTVTATPTARLFDEDGNPEKPDDGLGGMVLTADASVTPASPSLSLIKTADPLEVSTVGENVTYTFEIENTGDVLITDIAVTDPLPGLSTVDCFDENDDPFSGTLAPGESANCTATVEVTQAHLNAGGISNTATAEGLDPANRTVSDSDNAEVTANQGPALSVVKSTAAETFSFVGEVIDYEITVANTGNVTVTNIVVTDPTADIGSIDCGAFSGTLAPGEDITCTATVTVDQVDLDSAVIVNIASAEGTDPNDDPVQADSNEVSIGAAGSGELTVTKTPVSPAAISTVGEQATFEITVVNTGNLTISNVTVTDPQADSVDCGVFSGTLAPGADVTCTATLTVTQVMLDAGGVTNTATAEGVDPNDDPVSDDDDAEVPANQNPGLTVSKTANDASFDTAGQELTFEIVATNSGNVTITGITVTDPQADSVDCGMFSGTLAPGADVTCTATITVTQAMLDAGGVTNVATAEGVDPNDDPVSDDDDAEVPANQNPGLTVSKTANDASFDALSQTLTYVIEVENTGNVTITGITVTDPQADSVDCGVFSGTLAPGADVTCTATLTVTQAMLDAGGVTNTATAEGVDPNDDPVSDDDDAEVPANQSPGLTVTKTANQPSFDTAGQELTYVIEVENTGNVTITGITVTDPSADGGLVSCPFFTGTLAPGDTAVCAATITVTQVMLDAGGVTNTATAEGVDPNDDPVSDDDDAEVPANQNPALSIDKSVNPTTVGVANTEVAYTFVVVNTGNVTVTDVVVVDDLVASIDCGVFTGTLAPGADVTCTATYTVTQTDVNAGSVVNTAFAEGTDPNDDPVESDPDTATVTITQGPALTVSKTANDASFDALSQTLTYVIEVENTGNVTITGITVTDPQADSVDCGMFSGTLAPGADVTCTATLTVTQAMLDAGGVTNTATAEGVDPNDDPVSDDDDAEVPANQSPGLTVTKTANDASFDTAGQQLTYLIEVENTGNVTITGITVTDPLADGGVASCPFFTGTLAPGDTAVCAATITVTQAMLDAGGVTNTATAEGVDPNDDPVSDDDDAEVPANQNPALSIDKSVNPTTVGVANTEVTYTFVVVNTGNVTVTDVVVVDDLVASIDCGVFTGTLVPGDDVTCTATYTVTQTDVDAGSVVNTAFAEGTDSNDDPVESDPDTATVTITQGPALTVTKIANDASFDTAGQELTFDVRVENTGNVTITGITVTDPQADTVDCGVFSGTLAPGADVTCTATITVTQAMLDAGGVTNTATAEGVDPNDDPVSDDDDAEVPANQNPALSIDKSVNPTTVGVANTEVAYTFVVANTGNVTISDVVVVDDLDGLSVVDCGVFAGTLAPGDDVTCTATYTVTQTDVDAGSVVNTAFAEGTDPNDDPVESDPDTATVTINQAPGLTVTKTANQAAFTGVGQQLTFEIVAANTGNVTITGITVTDPQADSVDCGAFSGTLAPGADVTCTATLTVTPVMVSAGGVTNVATAEGFDPDDDPVSDDDTAEVPALVAVNDLYLTDFDVNVINTVAGNDTYPTGSTFAATSVAPNGEMTFGPTGAFTYDPNGDFSGIDSFAYQVCLPAPNSGVCTTATAVIVVGPRANDDAETTPTDTPVSSTVDTNDIFQAGSAFAATSGVAVGDLVFAGSGSYTYTPPAGFSGVVSFTYQVCLPAPHSVLCDSATVTVTVTPVGADDSATTPTNTPVGIDVLANDPSGPSLTVTSVTQGSNGAVEIEPDGTVTYTPATGFSGVDTFTYTATDGDGQTVTQTVSVTVTPVGADDSATTPTNTPVGIDVLANDPSGPSLTVTSVTQGSNGAVEIESDGTVTYTPATGFSGVDTFTYTATDGDGQTVTQTVSVTVTPVGADDSATTPTNTPVGIDVLANDPSGPSLTVTSVTQGSNGAVEIEPDGTVTYTPATGFSGVDTFTYTATDGDGQTVTQTVSVTVTPVGADDSATTPTNTPVGIDVLANDPSGPSLTVTSVTQGSNGAVEIESDGTVTYTPATGFSGVDTFTYTATDGDGQTVTQTVSVTVTPVGADDSATTPTNTPVGIDVLANDPSGPSLTVTSVTQGSNGAVEIESDGTVTYTPATGFSGVDTFTYTATDGDGQTVTQTVSVTVTPVGADDSATTPTNTPVGVDVLANDPSGPSLTVTSVTQGSNGAVEIESDGTVTYTPATGFSGVDTFTYTATDGDGQTVTQTVSVTVTPVGADDSATTPTNTPVGIDVLANDPSGPSLTVTSVTQGSNGAVEIESDGTVTYTPATGFSGVDTFTYTATDGDGQTVTQTVSVTVTPVGADDSATTPTNTPVGIDVLANDPSGPSLTVTSVTQGSNGAVEIESDGTVTYTPDDRVLRCGHLHLHRHRW